MIFPDPQYDRVVSLLSHGEENAIPAAMLAELAGFSNTRDLRKFVEHKRTYTVILSSDAGYFLPSENPNEAIAEINRFIRRKMTAANSIRKTTVAALAMLKEYNATFGQLDFWEGV